MATSTQVECNGLPTCNYTKTILNAMKRYEVMDEQQWIQFCSKTYKSLLNDFVHVIQHHNDDLWYIVNEKNMKCNVKNCELLLTHYDTNIYMSQYDNTVNNDFIFYKNLLNTIHCYVFHSYDIGLRVHKDEFKNSSSEEHDIEFSNIRHIITEKTKELEQIDNFKLNRFSSNKFNLNINCESINDDSTYMDGLFEYMTNQPVEKEQLNKLQKFIFDEEYDTDVLIDDVSDYSSNISTIFNVNDEKLIHSNISTIFNVSDNAICICGEQLIIVKATDCYEGLDVICNLCDNCITGNIYHCPKQKNAQHPTGFDICFNLCPTVKQFQMKSNVSQQNLTVYNFVQKFVQDVKLSKHSFSIGYRFYYWEFYKNNDSIAELQPAKNRHDHAGYDPSELYIESKYKSLKDEILNNKQHRLHPFQFRISLKKAAMYIETEAAKKFTAHVSDDFDVYKVYDFIDGDSLRIKNILSVTLYCDWSHLCTIFSKSFRKTKPYQSLWSVKQVNREYAIWSKILRETVELYGECRYDCYWNDNGIKIDPAAGPFFCGLSFLMVMPDINIRLCSPTSTSKKIEVATRFGGDRGMIIQLNNSGYSLCKQLRSFDCSWISNYTAESERLFFGGAYRIQIETIRNITTGQNFRTHFKPLYYFHCMINGTSMLDWSRLHNNENNYHIIIQNLINHRLKINGFKNDYCKYVNDTFEAFVCHQTQIVLDLYQIIFHYGQLKYLIMEETIDRIKFNDVMFKLFPNIRKLIICSTIAPTDIEYQYPINVLHFLSCIQSTFTHNIEITIKAISGKKVDHKSWLFDEYEVIRLYGEKDHMLQQFQIKFFVVPTSLKLYQTDILTIKYNPL